MRTFICEPNFLSLMGEVLQDRNTMNHSEQFIWVATATKLDSSWTLWTVYLGRAATKLNTSWTILNCSERFMTFMMDLYITYKMMKRSEPLFEVSLFVFDWFVGWWPYKYYGIVACCKYYFICNRIYYPIFWYPPKPIFLIFIK